MQHKDIMARLAGVVSADTMIIKYNTTTEVEIMYVFSGETDQRTQLIRANNPKTLETKLEQFKQLFQTQLTLHKAGMRNINVFTSCPDLLPRLADQNDDYADVVAAMEKARDPAKRTEEDRAQIAAHAPGIITDASTEMRDATVDNIFEENMRVARRPK